MYYIQYIYSVLELGILCTTVFGMLLYSTYSYLAEDQETCTFLDWGYVLLRSMKKDGNEESQAGIRRKTIFSGILRPVLMRTTVSEKFV